MRGLIVGFSLALGLNSWSHKGIKENFEEAAGTATKPGEPSWDMRCKGRRGAFWAQSVMDIELMKREMKNWGVNLENVKIGIVDSGFEKGLEENLEFKSLKKVAFNKDTTSTDFDELGHGTAVTGLIAGLGFGAAPGAQLTSYKVTNKENKVDFLGLEPLIRACEDGNEVINFSIGNYMDGGAHRLISDNSLRDEKRHQKVLERLSELGCVIVKAAGNESDVTDFESNSLENGYLRISSVDPVSLSHSSFSNKGVLSAPGKSVLSLVGRKSTLVKANACGSDHMTFAEGSSFAAPLVAGITANVIAVLKSDPESFYHKLSGKDRVKLLGRILKASEMNGLVNGYRAVLIARGYAKWAQGLFGAEDLKKFIRDVEYKEVVPASCSDVACFIELKKRFHQDSKNKKEIARALLKSAHIMGHPEWAGYWLKLMTDLKIPADGLNLETFPVSEKQDLLLVAEYMGILNKVNPTLAKQPNVELREDLLRQFKDSKLPHSEFIEAEAYFPRVVVNLNQMGQLNRETFHSYAEATLREPHASKLAAIYTGMILDKEAKWSSESIFERALSNPKNNEMSLNTAILELAQHWDRYPKNLALLFKLMDNRAITDAVLKEILEVSKGFKMSLDQRADLFQKIVNHPSLGKEALRLAPTAIGSFDFSEEKTLLLARALRAKLYAAPKAQRDLTFSETDAITAVNRKGLNSQRIYDFVIETLDDYPFGYYGFNAVIPIGFKNGFDSEQTFKIFQKALKKESIIPMMGPSALLSPSLNPRHRSLIAKQLLEMKMNTVALMTMAKVVKDQKVEFENLNEIKQLIRKNPIFNSDLMKID
jgi:hypothetical protein